MINAMTVDVEEYFQVSAFEKLIPRRDWETIESRVEGNVERILQLFDEKNIKATFFTLGWIAKRHPAMIERIVSNGHEIASHGWEHVRVTKQNSKAFREDITRTRALLEDLSGQVVKGYRAASYSIGRNNLWALDELAEAGYAYSSSIVPVHHQYYGMADAPRFAFPASEGRILEIPITTISVANWNINCSGGGWFRLFPYDFISWAIRQINEQDLQPSVFYIHPWEIDPDQPRPDGLNLKTRFRHYVNLDKTYARLERLGDDFHWGRMDEVFLAGS